MAIRLGIIAACYLTLVSPLHAATAESVVIHVSDSNSVIVRSFAGSRVELGDGKSGLVVWADGTRDRWNFFTGSWERPTATANSAQATDFVAESRGSSLFPSEGSRHLQLTTQLPQLRTPQLTRGIGSILTPYERAVLLDGRVTFRREASPLKKNLPAAEAVLRKGKKELLKVQFREGVSKIKWSELEGLPEELKDGVAPGAYELEMATPTGPERIAFSVSEPSFSAQLLSQQKELATLLSASHPLVIQISVEALLDNSPPILANALDILEDLDESKSTQRLGVLKEYVLKRLRDPSQRVLLGVAGDSTGDVKIDSIRSRIAACQWSKAIEEIEQLSSKSSENDSRTTSLATLYHAVVLSEAGQTREHEALSKFADALSTMKESSKNDDDLYRAHNCFANHFLGRSIDLLHGHAFRMASGDNLPLLNALSNWMLAQDHFLKALSLARTAEQGSSVELSLAHLHILLSEFLRTVASNDTAAISSEIGRELSRIANQYISDSKRRTQNSKLAPNLLLIGVGDQLRAHLAFNERQLDEARSLATSALNAYEDAGFLIGAESSHRLLAIIEQLSPDKRSQEVALSHLLVSDRLAEILRRQMPDDHIGFTRAAFLARRIYVSELIIGILVEAGRAEEALAFAELAKARSLYDTFSNSFSVKESFDSTRSAVDLMNHWPADVGAIAYFVGTTNVWLFAISPQGEVVAKKLTGVDGGDINSSALTNDIKRLIEYLDLFGPRTQPKAIMALETRSRQPICSDEWQQALHKLYETLWPEEIRSRLQVAKVVVVSPHKLLHYVPFPALVTKIDDAPESRPIALPKYLVEEPYCLVHAPSLLIWKLQQDREWKKVDSVNIVGIANFRERARSLPGIGREIEGIKRTFKSRVSTVLVDDDACESKVLQLLNEPGFLVLSTHGMKNPLWPLSSYLLCQPDGQRDGKLTAEEIFRTSVNADVVFLNACYSGFADQSPLESDDFFGLERALLSSGARTVISGIWDVSDGTTPEITESMMGELAKGKPIAEAMAVAQRKHLQKWRGSKPDVMQLMSHPYYWSCLNVVGDHRTAFNFTRDVTEVRSDESVGAKGIVGDVDTDSTSLIAAAQLAMEKGDTKALADAAIKSLSEARTSHDKVIAEQIWIAAVLMAADNKDLRIVRFLLQRETQ